jgi:NAD(P) transhydrogenase subunit alpha
VSRQEVFQTAEVLLQVRAPGANPDCGEADLRLMRRGQIVIGFGEPLTALDTARALADRGVTFLAMELMPRITRAQSMDALSSMATVAGYKAVLLAADALPRMFPMLMTAAGTITPARVLVIGAGVAGLQAIATARRLGAVVSGYDIRTAVKEQIESLGARFIVLDVEGAAAEDKGGYAKAMGEDFYRRQREAMAGVLAEQNVVITTAAVPGRKAPVLITSEMVARMAPGSVIVDIAAERGGNCELTQPGETVDAGGVAILGPLNLPSTVPYHASQMYAKNIATFLKYLVKDGRIQLNREDEIVRETLVAHEGDVVHPRVRELMGALNVR